jgi:MFS family permease
MLIRFSSATFLSRILITPFLLSVLALAGITGLASSFANNYISLVVILFLSGISFGAVRIPTTTIVAKNSTPENRGITNSLLDVSQATGNLTKILTSSTVIDGNFGSVFILEGITGLSAIIRVILLKVIH